MSAMGLFVQTLIRDTVHPSDVRGLAYIGLEHIAEGQLALTGYGSAEQVTSVKSRFREGDILFGKLRPYFRKVVIAPFDGVCSTDIWVVRRKQGIDQRYLFYWMASHEFIEESTRASEGTRMPPAQWEFVGRIEKPVPPLKEQRAIAHILGTLDDKIELNRRMSRTLEEMARAIFKSWFVDFDPVRAKCRGEPMCSPSIGQAHRPAPTDWHWPQHILDLFPDRLVDSELGEIPEGWMIGRLGDVADHPRRNVQPGQIEPQTPYIALEHMPRGCIALSDWSTGYGLESNKFAFRKGEILFGKLRPYFHKVGVAPVDGVCSTDIVVVAPRTPHWFAFVLSVVSSDEFVEYTNAGATGTKMPRTSWADMAGYQSVLPPEPVAMALTHLIQPSVDRMIAGIHESRTLAAIRDALLPKLISGAIRVKDAERFLKERGL